MKKILFLMIALLAVFSITTGAFAADSIDNEAVAMTLDWDEAAATLTLYQEDGTTGVVANAMTLLKSDDFDLGDTEAYYVGGLIYATVGGGAQPWGLALVTEGGRESQLIHTENASKFLPFKVDCEQEALENTVITAANWVLETGYVWMKKETDGGLNIFDPLRPQYNDLEAATMMTYSNGYMDTHTQIPFSFGIDVSAANLIGGEFTTEVKFLLYYD